MVMPTVIGTLGTISKDLVRELEELEIRGLIKILPTTASLRSDRILRRVLETCCHLDSSERPSASADVRILQW